MSLSSPKSGDQVRSPRPYFCILSKRSTLTIIDVNEYNVTREPFNLSLVTILGFQTSLSSSDTKTKTQVSLVRNSPYFLTSVTSGLCLENKEDPLSRVGLLSGSIETMEKSFRFVLKHTSSLLVVVESVSLYERGHRQDDCCLQGTESPLEGTSNSEFYRVKNSKITRLSSEREIVQGIDVEPE